MKRYDLDPMFSESTVVESPTGEWRKNEDVEKLETDTRRTISSLMDKLEYEQLKVAQLEADIKVLSEAMMKSHPDYITHLDDKPRLVTCTCPACEVARRYN